VSTISLVLADDHLLFCESLKIVLEAEAKEIQVVGIAGDGEKAVALVEQTDPDVVLMDVRMPRLDGVQAARIIHERFPRTRVMMLTTFDDDEYVREAMRYGAIGYLLKDTPLEKLIVSIRAIKEGVVLISPAVALKLVGEPNAAAGKDISAKDAEGSAWWVKTLSRREKEIVRLVAKGRDNSEIARELFIAEQTVKNHISEIYSKIGEHDRGKVALLVNGLEKDILLL
jgi:DNA-binding NarL/FixJ family response regulator